jgi:uncharacterized membrane protein YdjX (TVP38/TMEM64 family)
VRVRDYVLGTAVGITPGIGLSAYLGDAMIDAGSWRGLLTPDVLVPAAIALAGVVAGAILGRRLLGGVPAKSLGHTNGG